MENLRVLLKDIIVQCYPEDSSHPSLDALKLVLVGSGPVDLERVSPTMWKSDSDTVNIKSHMDGVTFAVQTAVTSDELGRLMLTNDDVVSYLAVQFNLTIERNIEAANPNLPSLKMQFTVDVQSARSDLNILLEQSNLMETAENFLNQLADFSKSPRLINHCGDWFTQRFRDTRKEQHLNNAILAYESAMKMIPTDHANYGIYVGDTGEALHDRGQLSPANMLDINRAIYLLEIAVHYARDDHYSFKAKHLNLLGLSLRCRFERAGDLKDIESAIANFQRAIEVSPDDSATILNNSGTSFISRFKRTGDLVDAENAIWNLRRAVEVASQDHTSLPTFLSNLGNILDSRFTRTRDFEDIESAISSLRRALELTPPGDVDMPSRLNGLGLSFYHRFGHTGNLTDIENAISNFQRAIELALPGDIDMPSFLGNLGNSYSSRFECTGNIADIENAVSNLQRAIELTPSGDMLSLAASLNNLGRSFELRFGRTGNVADIESAISNLRHAAELTAPNDINLPSLLGNIGSSLDTRFEQSRKVEDINDAISYLQRAVELTPSDGPHRSLRLNHLGLTFERRFNLLTQDLADIESAISHLQLAVDLAPPGDINVPLFFSNLGNSLTSRFQKTRDLVDIERAISNLQHAVDLTPQGDAKMPLCLKNLGNAFKHRFARTGCLTDIDTAISNLQRAVDLATPGDINLPTFLNDLGSSLGTRFQRTKELVDIESALSNLERAVNLTPPGNVGLPLFLCNLGSSLNLRFERTGDLADLESAISYLQRAVELTPDNHIRMHLLCHDLGIFFKNRFERTGDFVDLESAISNLQHAVRLTPLGHSSIPALLNNLGISFQCRFTSNRNLVDLENAIFNFQRAVELIPLDDANMPLYLNNLGLSFRYRFTRSRDPTDIENSISCLQRAVELIPPDAAKMRTLLTSLGNSFTTYFEHSGDLANLESGISNIKRAIEITPPGDYDLPGRLFSLGTSFLWRFTRTNVIADIHEAVSSVQRAIDLTPPDHPDISIRRNYLGLFQHKLFDLTKSGDYLDQAISNYRLSAIQITGEPEWRLTAAGRLMTLSHSLGRTDTLEVCGLAIELLSQVAGLEYNIHKRHANLRHQLEKDNLTVSATAIAIDAGRLDTALEWLEQGRCLVWSQIQHLRTPIEDLHVVNPDLATRFVRVAHALESSGSRREISKIFSEATMIQMIDAQSETQKHFELAREWNTLLVEIRALPDFQDFLCPPKAANLLSDPLPRDGAVVTFNISKDRCDALALVWGTNTPVHIALPNFGHQRAVELRDSLRTYLHRHGVRIREADRSGRLFSREHAQGVIYDLLRDLWKHVAKPVLDKLGYLSRTSNRPRIWWCPTGPLAFLPVHAAGIYAKDKVHAGQCVSDFVISSYTPTISTLLKKMKEISLSGSNERTPVLLVSQPSTPNLSSLPGARLETHSLKELLRRENVEPLLIEDDAASTAHVLEEMKEYSWVHFACHAVQDQDDPLKSGFYLHDARLELLDIMKQQIPHHAHHAFLSACQTSTGDEKLADEAVHLAAGMLAVGYRGVVATMWSIADAHAPEIAENFYKYILNSSSTAMGETARLDCALSAYALDDSIRKIREKLGDTERVLLSWVPYIHFGI